MPKKPFQMGMSLLLPLLIMGQIQSQSAYAMAIRNTTSCSVAYVIERTASDHRSEGIIDAKQERHGADLWGDAGEPARLESVYITIRPICKDQPNMVRRMMPAMSASDCEITCSTQHEVLQLTRNKACKPQSH